MNSTLLWLGAAGALALLRRGPVIPDATGVLGGTPGVIPGTVLPPGASTTPIVNTPGVSGTQNPVPVVVTNIPGVSPGTTTTLSVLPSTSGPGSVPVRSPSSGLSTDDIGKIAASAMKMVAGLFRKIQHGALPDDDLTVYMDSETSAAWASYRAGEWHVETDGTIVIDNPNAPVLNAAFDEIPNPTVLDVPLLVPSDYMYLNAEAVSHGLTGSRDFDVDIHEAFTPTSTDTLISQMSHEEMRVYLDSLSDDGALQFVNDASGQAGYTQADVLQGLNALGMLVGGLSIYQGIAAGNPISILGGVASVVSNFYQLAGLGQLPGLGVLTGILGIAGGIAGNNWLGIVSGTIGVITGVTTLAAAGAFGASAAALVATEVVTSILGFLSVLTIVVAVIGFMISNDMAQDAKHAMMQAREYHDIVRDFNVAWPQLIAGNKAALLLVYVPMLPRSRHIEALRVISMTTNIGMGAGAALARYFAAAGTETYHTGDVSKYTAVSTGYHLNCLIGYMRTTEALLRMGRQVEPGFYPLGAQSPESFLDVIATATHTFAMGQVRDFSINPDEVDQYGNRMWSGIQYMRGLAVPSFAQRDVYDPRWPDGDPALLDALVAPTERLCVEPQLDYDMDGNYNVVVGCKRWAWVPGSGFRATLWRGNMEEMILAVVQYYNPAWRETDLGKRLLTIGEYPVPLTAEQERAMHRQYEYRMAFVMTEIEHAIPDPWYVPTFVVPPKESWPTPRVDYAPTDWHPLSDAP